MVCPRTLTLGPGRERVPVDILSRLLVYYVILPATLQRVGFPCPWPWLTAWPNIMHAFSDSRVRFTVGGCWVRWKKVVRCDCIRRAWGRTTEKHSVTNLCRTCMVSILSHYAGQRKRRTASVGWIPSHGSALLWPPPLMNNLSSRSTQISCLRKIKGDRLGEGGNFIANSAFGNSRYGTPRTNGIYLR